MSNDRHINFKLLRDRIMRDQPPAAAGGSDSVATAKEYWRSLEELADSPIVEEFVRREFPHAADEWNDPVERRTFLKIMGASLALAGLSGCVIQPPATAGGSDLTDDKLNSLLKHSDPYSS